MTRDMPDEQKTKLRLEIAHVLFIDIVGYSKLRTTEQSAHIEKLRKIVRGTDQFRTAEAEGKLLRLPTGDGGALVFRNLEAPVLCAVEIANALRDHPELRVRMGIHSGPVNEVTDLNEQANIAGAGALFFASRTAFRTASGRVEPAPASAAAVSDKSIAVLPFENLSRDPDNAYFTDGIQDE